MQRKRKYSKGRWEVARERLHITAEVPPAPDRDASRLGDVLPALLKRLGLGQDLWLAALEDEWSELMGAVVAAHTRPGEWSPAKRLTVYVDSPVWLHEISRGGRGVMLENLTRRFGAGKIADLRFQLDPGPDEGSSPDVGGSNGRRRSGGNGC